jgi:hypothetical protein
MKKLYEIFNVAKERLTNGLLGPDRAHHTLGWECTTCHRHNSVFTGKCVCGEVMIDANGET